MNSTKFKGHPHPTFFLRGPIQIGKSTFLRRKVAELDISTAGLVTQKVFEGDKRRGFEAISFQGQIPGREGQYKEGRRLFIVLGVYDEAVLAGKIKETVRFAREDSVQLIYLDEIGGPELEDDDITEDLLKIITSGKLVVGVLKSMAHLLLKIGPKVDAEKIKVNYGRIADAIAESDFLVDIESIEDDLESKWRAWLGINCLVEE